MLPARSVARAVKSVLAQPIVFDGARVAPIDRSSAVAYSWRGGFFFCEIVILWYTINLQTGMIGFEAVAEQELQVGLPGHNREIYTRQTNGARVRLSARPSGAGTENRPGGHRTSRRRSVSGR